jgi:hypothetical protein
LLATGLLGLGFAHLPAYLLGWLVIGSDMGAGLYDPAFAALGRLYGHAGRSATTTLTPFGGFASTVCWPLPARSGPLIALALGERTAQGAEENYR